MVGLDVEPAVFADVTEVGRNGLHAPPSPGDLDHDLLRPAHDRGFDALADSGRPLSHGTTVQPGLGLDLDDPVARVEQAVTPLNEHAINVGCLGHGVLLGVSG